MNAQQHCIEARQAWRAAQEKADAIAEAVQREEYARMRAADKAAGADVGPRSVSGRKRRAIWASWDRPEVAEAMSAANRAHMAYSDARKAAQA